MQDSSVVLIGIGEIGGVLARGFLRAGFPLVPVNRSDDMNQVAAQIPKPALVVTSVAEKDLHPVLAAIPDSWRERLCLVQNELLPRDWMQHGIEHPTVASIWFEKKPGTDVNPLVPTPVYGPSADLVCKALQQLDIPASELGSATELLFELVRKNLYILTTNIAGLVTGGTVSELWQQHRTLAIEVAEEVLALQAWLCGEKLDNKALIAAMLVAFDGDPQHRCTGRSAPARLARALALAEEAGIDTPVLQRIQAEQ